MGERKPVGLSSVLQVDLCQHHVWVAISAAETAASLAFPVAVPSCGNVRSTRVMSNPAPAGGAGANYSCVCSPSPMQHII